MYQLVFVALQLKTVSMSVLRVKHVVEKHNSYLPVHYPRNKSLLHHVLNVTVYNSYINFLIYKDLLLFRCLSIRGTISEFQTDPFDF